MDHILFLTVYLSLFFFLFVCLFLYILAVPEWQKYLECESLCSSCTRTEIIAMIIKKNMTKLYMHHFRGGLVYCCIVTYEKILFFEEGKKKQKTRLLFLCPECSMCFSFLCLYHYLICLICNLTFTERKKKKKEDLSASIWSSCKKHVISSLRWFLTFYMCLLSVQHTDMNIQHQCTNSKSHRRFSRKSGYRLAKSEQNF